MGINFPGNRLTLFPFILRRFTQPPRRSTMHRTDDLRIRDITQVRSPRALHEEYPLSEQAAETVHATRHAIQRILHGSDDRLLVVVGPCSVHDPQAALEYAQRLQPLREELSAHLLLVMRVYFEKPRTTVGWKGLINDPNLDGSFEINKGLGIARKLLLALNEMVRRIRRHER